MKITLADKVSYKTIFKSSEPVMNLLLVKLADHAIFIIIEISQKFCIKFQVVFIEEITGNFKTC